MHRISSAYNKSFYRVVRFFLPFIFLLGVIVPVFIVQAITRAQDSSSAQPTPPPAETQAGTSLYLPVISNNAAPASTQILPPNQPELGLIYDGLEVDLTGECQGLYRVIGTDDCTHGPDPAPPALDVHRPVPPITDEVSAAAATVMCDGDGVSGKRVQVIYAHAADVANRYTTYLPSFQQWVADMDQIFYESALETGGMRRLRFVHDAACKPVILNITLSSTGDDTFSNMKNELKALGHNRVDRKYLVLMDADLICGLGNMGNDDRPGAVNVHNSGPDFARVDNGCWDRKVLAHELAHTLGAVADSAPNSTGQGHCRDEYDAMCGNDGGLPPYYDACPDPLHEYRFDCNHDDYFHTNPPAGSYVATHWNLADSEFLISNNIPAPTPIPPPVCPSLSNVNVLVNGDAEANWGSTDGSTVPVSGWQTAGTFTLISYSNTKDFPTGSTPGPTERGTNFFAGGLVSGSATATQIFDLTCQAAAVDNASVPYTLSGYLGGYSSQDDNVSVTVTFLNASNSVIGIAQIGPVLAADRASQTSMVLRTATGLVPPGARKVNVTVTITRVGTGYNDGYADNLSLAFGGTPPPCPTLPASNLLANGDAETGAGTNTGDVAPVAGWTTGSNLTLVPYNASGFLTSSDPGPANRGVNFFAGGPSNSNSSAYQIIDLTCLSAAIDNGGVTYTLSGYLGGYQSSNDSATLTVAMLSATNDQLATAQLGPVLATDRNNQSGLVARTTSATLPVGARKVKLTLAMSRVSGSYNDGYADNLIFALAGQGVPPTNTPIAPTATPVPPTNTPVPPTNTPAPPTNTPASPTSTPTPVCLGVPSGNLLINGDAETGTANSSGEVVPVANWTATGNFTLAPYGANGFPSTTNPGPTTRGVNFFAGGPSNASSSAYQILDLTCLAAQIDGGGVGFTLAGYLGGYSNTDDHAVVSATWLTADNSTLGSSQIGPVLATERGNQTGLWPRTTMGNLPVGTRKVKLTISMTRTTGSYNDGYADNLTFVLNSSALTPTNTPAPPTATNTPIPPTATPTNTPAPPTATNTPVPSTATPTSTPVSPTATPAVVCLPIPSANLLANPNAESGAGTASGGVVPVAGWTTTGNFTLAPYGASGFPSMTSPGPTTRGVNFFAGGPSNASSSAYQIIDLTCLAAQIDSGAVGYTFGGYLGGYSSDNDNAKLQIDLLGASNNTLYSLWFGPIYAADRGGQTGLLSGSTTKTFPGGTRKAKITLTMTRTNGSYNDGYADNIVFQLVSP